MSIITVGIDLAKNVFAVLLRANRLSGFVAQGLSDFIGTEEVAYETDGVATGDSEDEI